MLARRFRFITLLLFSSGLFAQPAAAQQTGTVSANESILLQCFLKADAYIRHNHYDSAQLLIDSLPVNTLQEADLRLQYDYHAIQAWIYINQNINQPGFTESEWLLKTAKKLNDSFLVADAYFKLTNAYFNAYESRKAVDCAQLALQYYPVKGKTPLYVHSALQHRVCSALASVYESLGKFDSTILYAKKIIPLENSKFNNENWGDAYLMLYHAYNALQIKDSVRQVVQQIKNFEAQTKNNEAKLMVYICLVDDALKRNIADSAYAYAQDGISLVKADLFINVFSVQRFLYDVIALIRPTGNKQLVIDLLDLQTYFYIRFLGNNQRQLAVIEGAIQKKENIALALELESARQKQQLASSRLLMALGGIALLVIGFLVYRYYQNQKLAISKIRQTISQDLHDDIGASLSSLQIYGTIAEQSFASNPEKAIEMLHKINTQSRDILENMSDIVWSMKSNSTGGTSLETKIKNYASELLQEKQVHFTCVIQPEAEMALHSLKARKNILLIIREILNNTHKYSRASQLTLHIYVQDKNWIMDIADNGIGMDTTKKYSGNGLKNIQSRTAELKGTYTLQGGGGTRFMFVFPLVVITDTGW